MVRNLALFNGVLVLGLVGYARYLDMPLAEIVPLVLTAVLGSIPVALPATFTLTCNALTVASVYPEGAAEAQHVLDLAALASSEGGQDPVDAAIRDAARGNPIGQSWEVTAFVPFDPATKMSEATVLAPDGTSRFV